jgi:hypothetical protein
MGNVLNGLFQTSSAAANFLMNVPKEERNKANCAEGGYIEGWGDIN